MIAKIRLATVSPLVGEPFNNFPGMDALDVALNDQPALRSYRFVDLAIPNWKNDRATVVLAFPIPSNPSWALDLGLRVGAFARLVSADEFDWKRNFGSNLIVRLWWD